MSSESGRGKSQIIDRHGEPVEIGFNTDKNGGVSLVDSLPNLSGGYATGYTATGDLMAAIATKDYKILYMPTFGMEDADAREAPIGNIYYPNGTHTHVYANGDVGGLPPGSPEAAAVFKDFMGAIDQVKQANGGRILFPEKGTPVASGALIDQATAVRDDNFAYLEGLKRQYGALPAAPTPGS